MMQYLISWNKMKINRKKKERIKELKIIAILENKVVKLLLLINYR
jgi:hypothetical protein